jgi:hypothetical protein
MLVPREMASAPVPEWTDYVCVDCRCPHRWTGDPPSLSTQPPEKPPAADDSKG